MCFKNKDNNSINILYYITNNFNLDKSSFCHFNLFNQHL